VENDGPLLRICINVSQHHDPCPSATTTGESTRNTYILQKNARLQRLAEGILLDTSPPKFKECGIAFLLQHFHTCSRKTFTRDRRSDGTEGCQTFSALTSVKTIGCRLLQTVRLAVQHVGIDGGSGYDSRFFRMRVNLLDRNDGRNHLPFTLTGTATATVPRKAATVRR
jgi:hypothetical protein